MSTRARTGLAAVWAGTPVILAHHHDTLVEKKNRQKALTRWLSARTDRVLCVSERVRQGEERHVDRC